MTILRIFDYFVFAVTFLTENVTFAKFLIEKRSEKVSLIHIIQILFITLQILTMISDMFH